MNSPCDRTERPVSAVTAATRADLAARSVVPSYGRAVWGIPGTHLAVRALPVPPPVDLSWNYWWQAHHLDAIVDAGWRHWDGTPAGHAAARAYLRLGRELLRGIWLRNGGRWTNAFFDDMGWLVLAAGRVTELGQVVGAPPVVEAERAVRRIGARLIEAQDDVLGGGVYWTVQRDRKNVPATAPAAIHAARSGDVDRARDLVDWIYRERFDETAGLALDTVYVDGRRDDTVYTYNQGTLLGALLAVGGPAEMAAAEALIAAVNRRWCAEEDSAPRVVTAHGDGDGGLFTGILIRYLGVAARESLLSSQARRLASAMVLDTAQAWWQGGRWDEDVQDARGRRRTAVVFSRDPMTPAEVDLPVGSVCELTPQLQAWMALEAAAAIVNDQEAAAAVVDGEEARDQQTPSRRCPSSR
ncbi:glycoside hydrolase family 76 protein [Austwickia sp. TVS 96-490-7B]|uniref:glycoside hydrolase family 76 protein n=1 Tax=Austwickia sp. TVS 96-490-7B TaxID=2830843 RepID=UPI001C58D294|nr:glycoside hydrolase family 76 protein [Austwickia sp. TVS 96-490-7B]